MNHTVSAFGAGVVSNRKRTTKKYDVKNEMSSNFNNDAITTSTPKEEHQNEVVKSSIFGGTILRRIKMEGEDNESFVSAMKVPTFTTADDHDFHPNDATGQEQSQSQPQPQPQPQPTKASLEGVIPGAFLLHNAFTSSQCESMITTCEDQLKFHTFSAGKNNHGALQVLISKALSSQVFQKIGPYVDINSIPLDFGMAAGEKDEEEKPLPVGINRRWRIYRYQPGKKETFAPHIDAGFPPSGLSKDGTTLLWDVTNNNDAEESISDAEEKIVSRLTVLIYLNDDFEGGYTRFYAPLSSTNGSHHEVVASIKPKQGSILVFPQAVGEEAVEYANTHWNLHEGSEVLGGNRAKYVIRTDVLFSSTVVSSDQKQQQKEDENDPLFRYDHLVRQTFLPKSSSSKITNPTFLHHIQHLYNPHMGVENVSYLLYSFIRFTKARNIVEIGAGYTSLWILQALKDNDEEMKSIRELQRRGECRLFDWPWTVHDQVEHWDRNDDNGTGEEGQEANSRPFFGSSSSSSLLCIDNCLHQRETATGASSVARTLNLDQYLHFIKGDAFEMSFEPNSIDILWCDFGVGSRIQEFVSNAWGSIRLGGFLICHSTLTNQKTREWLEACRNGEGEDVTGMKQGEYVELSLLEPHKHYQNSISIFQKRRQGCRKDGLEGSSDDDDEVFEEPLFSVYA